MLFDLVKRKKDGKVMTVVELRYAETIAAITPNDVYYGDMEDYHESEIEPIPLTPEILKKNGFTNCETTELTGEMGNELWYPGEDNYISDPDLMINFGKRSFLVRFACSIVWRLHYVHELQHFLRLVDYDKEIVL